jgi:hypothetical protein
MLMLLSGPAMAQMSVATDPDALSKKICSNLAATSQQVLDDHSDTRKYLSPYIASELYEQVAADSLASLGVAATDELRAPEMSSLPCQDTVSDFMMAIKKRMEYGRFDRMLVAYRVWFVGGGVVLLGGLLIFGLFRRRQTG